MWWIFYGILDACQLKNQISRFSFLLLIPWEWVFIDLLCYRSCNWDQREIIHFMVCSFPLCQSYSYTHTYIYTVIYGTDMWAVACLDICCICHFHFSDIILHFYVNDRHWWSSLGSLAHNKETTWNAILKKEEEKKDGDVFAKPQLQYPQVASRGSVWFYKNFRGADVRSCRDENHDFDIKVLDVLGFLQVDCRLHKSIILDIQKALGAKQTLG